MKYAIIIPDGCADEPQDSLDGKTPLQSANLPAMDSIAASGVVGQANHVPSHLTPGSAVANMSLLGYDPIKNFTGRAPIEAVAQKIELADSDWAIRCNLVTVENQVMKSFTADQISTEEATLLLESAQQALGGERFQFIPGVGYRNLLIHRGEDSPFTFETSATPPHDLTDKSITNDFPRGPGSDQLSDMMSATVDLFKDHPVNAERVASGKLPATNIWLWGVGRRPSLESFQKRYGINGAMITAVDLLRGLAILVGWDCIEVPGATGYTDTDYSAKGRYAIEALKSHDIVCVHVEAPDEASHEGDVEAKISSLEEIDSNIVGPIHESLKSSGDYRIMVTPDHPTPCRTKTHSHGGVPFAICGSGIDPDKLENYDELAASASELQYPEGNKLMRQFVESDT